MTFPNLQASAGVPSGRLLSTRQYRSAVCAIPTILPPRSIAISTPDRNRNISTDHVTVGDRYKLAPIFSCHAVSSFVTSIHAFAITIHTGRVVRPPRDPARVTHSLIQAKSLLSAKSGLPPPLLAIAQVLVYHRLLSGSEAYSASVPFPFPLIVHIRIWRQSDPATKRVPTRMACAATCGSRNSGRCSINCLPPSFGI